MRKLKAMIVLVAMILFNQALVGCAESTGSENIKTAGMYAEMEVRSENVDNTKVTVQLRVGGPNSNTYIDLGPDDVLEVSDGVVTKVMSKYEPNLNEFEYVANFDNGIGGVTYTIDFIRNFEDDALGSSITLPASVDIESPIVDTEIPRDTSFTVRWLSEDEYTPFDLAIYGSCLKNYFKQVTFPEYLEWIINAGELSKSTAGNSSCKATIETTREGNDGVISVEFKEGGNIHSQMSKSQTFTSVPFLTQ